MEVSVLPVGPSRGTAAGRHAQLRGPRDEYAQCGLPSMLVVAACVVACCTVPRGGRVAMVCVAVVTLDWLVYIGCLAGATEVLAGACCDHASHAAVMESPVALERLAAVLCRRPGFRIPCVDFLWAHDAEFRKATSGAVAVASSRLAGLSVDDDVMRDVPDTGSALPRCVTFWDVVIAAMEAQLEHHRRRVGVGVASARAGGGAGGVVGSGDVEHSDSDGGGVDDTASGSALEHARRCQRLCVVVGDDASVRAAASGELQVRRVSVSAKAVSMGEDAEAEAVTAGCTRHSIVAQKRVESCDVDAASLPACCFVGRSRQSISDERLAACMSARKFAALALARLVECHLCYTAVVDRVVQRLKVVVPATDLLAASACRLDPLTSEYGALRPPRVVAVRSCV